VMPKEAFKTEDEKVVVGWSKNGYVEIGVSLGDDTKIQVIQFGKKKHEIAYASFYDDVFATFDDEEEFNKFLKALTRAGKQAFGKK
jgi:hypothetical protein